MKECLEISKRQYFQRKMVLGVVYSYKEFLCIVLAIITDSEIFATSSLKEWIIMAQNSLGNKWHQYQRADETYYILVNTLDLIYSWNKNSHTFPLDYFVSVDRTIFIKILQRMKKYKNQIVCIMELTLVHHDLVCWTNYCWSLDLFLLASCYSWEELQIKI